MEIAYFLGCIMNNRYPGIEKATRQLFDALDIELKDNQKASFLQPDGSYCRKKIDTEEPFNSQEYFMEHSLHKPEISMHNKPNLFKEMISRLNKWLENK